MRSDGPIDTGSAPSSAGAGGGVEKGGKHVLLSVESAEYYQSDVWYSRLYILYSFLSLGILPIIDLFIPTVGARICNRPCKELEADMVVIKLHSKEYVAAVHQYRTINEKGQEEHVISLEANCLRICGSSADSFELYVVPEVPRNFKRFLSNPQGGYCDKVSKEQLRERGLLQAQYGKNSINVPVTNLSQIIARHALNPIILFGYFAIIIWTIEDYYWYSGFLALVLVLAIYVMTADSVFNLQRLRDLAGTHGVARVLDSHKGPQSADADSKMSQVLGSVFTVPDTELIVGDRMLIGEGFVMPCDAVLISGRLVMDESKLTGESIPVSKVTINLLGLGGTDADEPLLSGRISKSLPADALLSNSSPLKATAGEGGGGGDLVQGDEDPSKEVDIGEKRAGSVLFGGTQVKSAVGDCVCVIYRTGFRSSKGSLIASLLTPKERFLHIFEDVVWVILFLFLIATALYIYEAVYLRSIGTSWGEVMLLYFDALTVAIPVVLIICIIIATTISIYRLKFKEIYVSESSAVNLAGIVSVACFDKTGTLTEEGLDFQGASLSAHVMQEEESGGKGKAPAAVEAAIVEFVSSDAAKLPLLVQEVMATCHNLSVLRPGAPPVGDTLEVELFRASGWSLNMADKLSGKVCATRPLSAKEKGLATSSSSSSSRYEILRHFEFSQDRMRTASLVQRPSGELIYLIKGSPETILQLCRADTVPAKMSEKLVELGKRGMRNIAVAYRLCSEPLAKLASASQDEIEGKGDVIFGGLLYMTNRLKVATVPTIAHLLEADVRVSMITGDYIYTAISVAVECGIIQAPSGKTGFSLYVVDEDETKEASGGGLLIRNMLTDQIEDISLIDLLLKAAVAADETSTPVLPKLLDHSPDLESPAGRDGASAPAPSSSSSVHQREFVEVQKRSPVQIAVTGRGLRVVKKKESAAVVNSLVRCAQVFARTKPNDKKYIVEQYMYTPAGIAFAAGDDGEEDEVLFCGDGANDMAALRASTVGLSLCDVETSIAAPITSKLQTPGATIDLLLEGRASLITTYVLVHYNIMFGYIVLLATCLLFGYGIMLSDSMYFIQSLFFVGFPGIAIAITPHSDRLGVELPPKRYFTPWLLTQMIPQLLCFTGFQVYALYLLSQQSFYTQYYTDDPLTSTYSYEATTIENVVLAQLLIASIVSTIGEPFRKEWYTNEWHIGALLILTGWFIYQCFAGTSDFAENTLNLEPVPTYFGYYLLAIAAANTVVSFVLWTIADRCCRTARKRRQLAIFSALTGKGAEGEALEEVEKRATSNETDNVEEKMPLMGGGGGGGGKQ